MTEHNLKDLANSLQALESTSQVVDKLLADNRPDLTHGVFMKRLTKYAGKNPVLTKTGIMESCVEALIGKKPLPWE